MSGAKAESGASVMGRVAHPAKLQIEFGHALNQVRIDETPEARTICQDVRASLFLVL